MLNIAACIKQCTRITSQGDTLIFQSSKYFTTLHNNSPHTELVTTLFLFVCSRNFKGQPILQVSTPYWWKCVCMVNVVEAVVLELGVVKAYGAFLAEKQLVCSFSAFKAGKYRE